MLSSRWLGFNCVLRASLHSHSWSCSIISPIRSTTPHNHQTNNNLSMHIHDSAGIAQSTTYSNYPQDFIFYDNFESQERYYNFEGVYIPDQSTAVVSAADCTGGYPIPQTTSCDDGIEFVRITCPYVNSGVFIGMLSMWFIWTFTTVFVQFFYSAGFNTTDLRYYLISERFKFTLLSNFLTLSGFVLTIVTALVGVVYEASSDGSYCK